MTVEIKAHSGIRNDVSSERFSPSDLLTGINIDIDETGQVSRRLGVAQISAGATSSLWSADTHAYYVRSNSLYQLNVDKTTKVLATGVAKRVAYESVAGVVYWSDGLRAGRVSDGASHQWGVTPPPNAFTLREVPGDLPAGSYGVTLVYMRGSQESGAPRGQFITVADNSALRIDNIPVSSDPTVTGKALYITSQNGEVFFRSAILHPSDTSVTVFDLAAAVLPLRTQFKGAAPAGNMLGFHGSRMYVVQGDTLWYSDPFEYELFDLRSSFIRFPSNITLFAPVNDGVFLGIEDETFFLQGMEPSQFVSTTVASYGAIPGTLVYPALDLVLKGDIQGSAGMWMSQRGVCLGLTGGQFSNLTSARFTASSARRGGALFKLRAGAPYYVASLFS